MVTYDAAAMAAYGGAEHSGGYLGASYGASYGGSYGAAYGSGDRDQIASQAQQSWAWPAPRDMPVPHEENQKAIEYNKTIKHHLQRGNMTGARDALNEMKYMGVRPTTVTYNELLNYHVKNKDLLPGLRIVGEMRREGLQPNRISASTILKALDERTPQDVIDQVVDVLRWVASTEGSDEILISSVAETTVRVGSRAPKLVTALRSMMDGYEGATWSAQTCGSLIRAHGHARDTGSMWKLWKRMMESRIRPTVVTTGCMVEQLVVNGQISEAEKLVHDLQGSGYGDCVNAVAYCSLIKGLSKDKKPDKVWEVYQEMLKKKLEFSLATFNGLVGAFAECGCIDKVQVLFDHMKETGLRPSNATWTRLAKGHCLEGNIKKAVDVMEQMRETNLRPDEIFYNSLLDGCAEHGCVDEDDV